MDGFISESLAPLLGLIAPVEQFRLGYPLLCGTVMGFVAGFLVSIPVGPVNLTIVNEGARRGFRIAAHIAAGATLMEVIYCFIAFTSLGSFFQRGYVQAAMELISFVFLLYLGIKFLMVKSVYASVQFGTATDKIEKQVEERLHPHSAFMTGFVRVLGNVGVLVFWVICAANLIAYNWVRPDWPGKMSCVGGVALGTGSWFILLSFCASRGYGRLSEKTLLRMEHFSGICLLGLASFHGFRLVRQLALHQLR